MSKVLYVAWRSSSESGDHQWGPVGRLDNDLGHYRFAYTEGAKKLKNFIPFTGMDDIGRVYESNELLPLFKNRMLSSLRPEYQDFLTWSGFNPKHPPESLELLGITEGLRATDNLELFPCPQPNSNNRYQIKFFLHGIRHMPKESQAEIGLLNSGESLGFMFDVSNLIDPFAVAVRTCPDRNRLLIGYLPRYLARDIKTLFDRIPAQGIKLTVDRVNADAPLQQRLLCRMDAPWPQLFRPCEGEDFQPVVGDLACYV